VQTCVCVSNIYDTHLECRRARCGVVPDDWWEALAQYLVNKQPFTLGNAFREINKFCLNKLCASNVALGHGSAACFLTFHHLKSYHSIFSPLIASHSSALHYLCACKHDGGAMECEKITVYSWQSHHGMNGCE
jgi:hypothetical protein